MFFSINAIYGNNVSTKIEAILPEYSENLKGLEQGDQIIKINGKKIRLKSDITKVLNKIAKDNVVLTVKRMDTIIDIEVKTSMQDGIFFLGVMNKPEENNFSNNIYYAYWETENFVVDIFDNLKLLFTGKVSADQFTGPIGISEYIVKTDSVYNFFYLMSLISLSLGITNLLPIPALDGGKIVVLIIEGIRRKPIDEKLEMKIQAFGFSLLIMLSIYISFKDVLRIFSK